MPHARAFFAPIIRFLFRRTERQTPIDPKTVRRVLILRYDAIGDGILTMPMIDFIRAVCPLAMIDVLTSPRNDMVFAAEPFLRRYRYNRTLAGYIALWWKMRHNRYDVTFSVVHNKTTLAGWLANTLGKSAVTAAIEHAERRNLYSVWFNMQVPQKRCVENISRIKIRLAAAVLGCEPRIHEFPLRLTLPGASVAFAREIVPDGIPTVLLNLSASTEVRMISEQCNLKLVQHLRLRYPEWKIVISGYGPRVSMAERIAAAFGNEVAVVPPTSFLHLAAVCSRAVMLISPDTSVVHAAAAVGTPVVALYSSRVACNLEWMPYGVPFESVVSDQDADLHTLAPERIADAVDILATRLNLR